MCALGWPYRGRIAAALALGTVAVIVTLAMPLGLRALLNGAVQKATPTLLNHLAALLLGLYLLRALVNFIGPFVLKVTGEQIVCDLRGAVYQHLHRQGLVFFSEQRVGDLMSRLSNDVASVRSAVTDSVSAFLMQVLRFVGAVAVMLALNWRLSLIVFVVAPAATVISLLFGPRILRASRELQDRIAQAHAMAQEALSGIRLVQAFGRSDYEVQRFRGALRTLFTSARDLAYTGAFLHSAVEMLFTLVLVFIFWYGGLEVLGNRLTAGDLVAFMFYSQALSGGVGELIQLYSSLSSAVGASSRVFEILDLKPELIDRPGATLLRSVSGELVLERVSFNYSGTTPVLRRVSLSVKPGERVVIVGPSGAGKTTLLNLVLRLFDPSQGRIMLDGHDISSLQLRFLRQQVAIVSQDTYLFADTVRENIRYGRLDATAEEVETAARVAHAHEFVMSLDRGYDTHVGEAGVKLSGGQRQRIAIARAVLKDARVLLLDEATSSVDPIAEQQIHEALEDAMRDRTTIMVTHRLAAIRGASRILVMDDGRIVEEGTHDHLIARGGVYSKLSLEQSASAVPGVAAVSSSRSGWQATGIGAT